MLNNDKNVYALFLFNSKFCYVINTCYAIYALRANDRSIATNNHITKISMSLIMMTSSNGNTFSATGLLQREFTGHRWIPRSASQRPVTRSFDIFFDLCLSQQLYKQWRRQWLETPSRSLWRHGNVTLRTRLVETLGIWCSVVESVSRYITNH